MHFSYFPFADFHLNSWLMLAIPCTMHLNKRKCFRFHGVVCVILLLYLHYLPLVVLFVCTLHIACGEVYILRAKIRAMILDYIPLQEYRILVRSQSKKKKNFPLLNTIRTVVQCTTLTTLEFQCVHKCAKTAFDSQIIVVRAISMSHEP